MAFETFYLQHSNLLSSIGIIGTQLKYPNISTHFMCTGQPHEQLQKYMTNYLFIYDAVDVINKAYITKPCQRL